MGTDCKSVGESLRRFESYSAHQESFWKCPHSSAVEHFFGKEEVTGSILVEGSSFEPEKGSRFP